MKRKTSFSLGLAFLLLFTIEKLQAEELPLLETKQAINNLRYLANDGKFTYYQRRSGSLLFSTNYKVTEVMKGEIGTSYNITNSEHKINLVLTKDITYHLIYNIRKSYQIFIIPYGKHISKRIGEGVNPKLHLKDQWISYYEPYENTLIFQNIKRSVLSYKIRLKNKKNPYFIPQVIMLSDNTILFTDLNAKGIPGVILFERNSKKLEAVYKADTPYQRIELCRLGNQLYVGEFGLSRLDPGSYISQISTDKFDYLSRKVIYESPYNDIGHIRCKVDPNKLYFVRNNKAQAKKEYYEAAVLDLQSKKVKTLTSLKFVTQITYMDGFLLVPQKGKYYVIHGKNDLNKVD